MSAAVVLLALPGVAAAMRKHTTKQAHSHRFLVVQKLKRGLRGTPLARHAFLQESEERWPDPAPSLAKIELMKAENVDPVTWTTPSKLEIAPPLAAA